MILRHGWQLKSTKKYVQSVQVVPILYLYSSLSMDDRFAEIREAAPHGVGIVDRKYRSWPSMMLPNFHTLSTLDNNLSRQQLAVDYDDPFSRPAPFPLPLPALEFQRWQPAGAQELATGQWAPFLRTRNGGNFCEGQGCRRCKGSVG